VGTTCNQVRYRVHYLGDDAVCRNPVMLLLSQVLCVRRSTWTCIALTPIHSMTVDIECGKAVLRNWYHSLKNVLSRMFPQECSYQNIHTIIHSNSGRCSSTRSTALLFIQSQSPFILPPPSILPISRPPQSALWTLAPCLKPRPQHLQLTTTKND